MECYTESIRPGRAIKPHRNCSSCPVATITSPAKRCLVWGDLIVLLVGEDLIHSRCFCTPPVAHSNAATILSVHEVHFGSASSNIKTLQYKCNTQSEGPKIATFQQKCRADSFVSLCHIEAVVEKRSLCFAWPALPFQNVRLVDGNVHEHGYQTSTQSNDAQEEPARGTFTQRPTQKKVLTTL